MKKIVSAILAASFIFASCAMNVMAADNTARTLTVSATPNKDLQAGDIVTVEVKLSDYTNLDSCGFRLLFDEDVFAIDTAAAGRGEPAKYIDSTWFAELSNKKTDWGLYIGEPTIGQTTSSISFAYAGAYAITDIYDTPTDFTVGKFKFTVKDGVTVESSEIKIDSDKNTTNTSTNGVSDDLTTVPCTVEFKQAAPTPVENKWSVVIDNATGDMAATDDNKVWSVKPSKTGTPDDIDKFNLTLKSGEDSVVKSIKTADLNKIMNAWNTGFEFFIGFENVGNHENVTAAWDIAAGTTAIVPTGTAIN